MRKVCLIIVDSLRYDAITLDDIPKNFHFAKCRSLANTTEPSIATILTGKPPELHGIVRLGQANARELLRKHELLPNLFETSFIASPAIIFHEFFTYASQEKYIEEQVVEARKYLDKVEFVCLHCMNCHDLKLNNPELAYEFYEGYEPIPKEIMNWKPPSGLKRPYEDVFRQGDAGWLKALYKACVKEVFKHIREFVESLRDWLIVITGDHGESFTYWHHDGVYEREVFEVPLITNFPLAKEEYTHTEIYSLIQTWTSKIDVNLDRKVKKSLSVIKEAFERFERLGACFTGGKDSTVMLHLIKQVRDPLDIPIFFIDTGRHFPEIYEFVNSLAKEWNLNLVIAKDLSLLKDYDKLSKREKELALGEYKIKMIQKIIKEYKIQGLFVAIRWDECEARSREVYFSEREDHVRIHPLLHFSERDIWEYIRKYNVPYCKLYDLGYRSIGDDKDLVKPVPPGMPERAGREIAKEKIMERLRLLGYF